MKYEMKPLFEERMRKLLPDEDDFDKFNRIVHEKPLRFIRCNMLKISSDELIERLRKKWRVSQPFENHEEIILVEGKKINDKNSNIGFITADNSINLTNDSKGKDHNAGKDVVIDNLFMQDGYENNDTIIELSPGELGNSVEHLLGYFYVQEISSMLPPLALNPKAGEFVLDLTASPGSKTTQMAAMMKNKGTIIANDKELNRIKILSANLERCGVMNAVVTRNDAVVLCENLFKKGYRFDKILLDAPCSGEGTLRSSPKTFKMWNIKTVRNLSRQQKKMFASALRILKKNGEIVYSTCTHSPEENEELVDFALRNFPVAIKKINFPLKCREGIFEWNGKEYDKKVKMSCRIYPQDNDSEGFFIAKFKLFNEIGDAEKFR